MSCPCILVITRPSWGSTMVRCRMIGKRHWWAKGSVSWGARWKTATHLSVVLVILWSLLRNTTKVTHTAGIIWGKNCGFDGKCIQIFIIGRLLLIQEVDIIVGSAHCYYLLIMSLKKVDPPFKYKTVEYDVMKVLKNFPYVVLTILSVYVCQKLGDFSISAHHCA